MTKRISIIDDDSMMLLLQKRIIGKVFPNHEIYTFESANEALIFFDNHVNCFHYIFLDLNMPQMNGWEFLDRVKNSSFKNNIAVVIVTSSIDQNDISKSNKYDVVQGFISKPITVNKITELNLQR